MNQFEILRNFCRNGKKFNAVEEIPEVAADVLHWVKMRVTSGELILEWLLNNIPRDELYEAIKASDEDFKKVSILWRLRLVDLAELHFNKSTRPSQSTPPNSSQPG